MTAPPSKFFRYRAARPSHLGIQVGIFGLVNVLGRQGMLTEAEERCRVEQNAWYDAAYPDPSVAAPGAYEPPGAVAWFKVSGAEHLLDRISIYTDILDSHRIDWECVSSDDPGVVVYEDEVQIVVRPHDG